ncbi:MULTISPECIES: ABC transporter substrate-binding protein [Nocardiaceae]|uniref:ABC transporter substrate-binding protein n=1 Tax=Rhodococcoides kroppenstedtii TaxID=293050 RepID=A0ABS7NNV2_9NOCA|nr:MULTISPECIES: ABC transporter substrate-binding protein [Rhodococcus]MBY6312231.1 ABC transporter substrate-binding protein [Rhodococcus kroppenstedtii]MBY6319685.1 ABC transporter substrate-binding protein [Rhodococcus kroppenstedtii]MBY6398368.1 ABC transporter substrate-binding protein [Rhodococcus kroppenstedtii]
MNTTRRTRHPRRGSVRLATTALVASAALALSACGGGDSNPLSSGGEGGSGGDTNAIVVGSANFTESEIIANIYADALRANGFDASTRLSIGSREAYIPAVQDGSIDLIPDYTGNLLLYLDPEATATASDEVSAALTEALPDDLSASTPAPAEDKDAVVVTRETAERWNLTNISDLAPYAGEVRFGGPPEFAERPVGLPGLRDKYGVDIPAANFVPISDGGGPATVAALVSGEITAANLFTTTPAIVENDLVPLADPDNNFPAQNVVPVYNSSKASDKLTAVLNAVSEKLTTVELLALNQEVSGANKTEPAAAASAWVAEQGLDKPVQ